MKVEITERQAVILAAFIFDGLDLRPGEGPIEITATEHGTVEEIDDLLRIISPTLAGLRPVH